VIKEMYANLLEQGWTFNEIDEINDIHFYFEVLSHEKTEKKSTGEVFIDQIQW
jgi:hypothetical protein